MAPTVGDTVPDGYLSFVNSEDEIETVSLYSLITGKRVLFYGYPDAFLPNSSWSYQYRQLYMAMVFQRTLYVTVNDPYVTRAWKNVPDPKFLVDSNAAYVASLGLDLDLTSQGSGVRCKRFCLMLDDRKVIAFFEPQKVLESLVPSLERPTPSVSRAPIAVGDIIPDGTLTFINQQYQTEPVSVHSTVTGKKVIILGVPGAISPGCSNPLILSFVEKAAKFKLMGVHEILCISVNDPYVMNGWIKTCFGNDRYIHFLADPTAAYVTSLGLVDDLSHTEYGIHSKRFALLLENCRVKVVEVRGPSNDMLVAGDMLVAMLELKLRDMELELKFRDMEI